MDAAGFEPARISSVGLKSTALTNSAKHPNNINRYYVFKSFCIIIHLEFLETKILYDL